MGLVLVAALVLAAVAVTALVTWLVAERRLAHHRAGMAAELAAAHRDNQWLRDDADRQREALGSTQTLLDTSERRLREAFQSLAAEALRDNRGAFLDLAKLSFEGYQQPIAETLTRVDAKLGEAERDRIAAYAKLSEQVAALGSTTSTLARALRTPAVRGRWGEMQLRRVVELAGMLHRCDFDEQPELPIEGGRQRPDLVVHLPGGKQIVVDAKAPLEAFLNAQESPDDASRVEYFRAHARQVREHVEKLGSKAYWDSLDRSPEMVVLFLPGETLFAAALQQDLTLIEHGLEKRVLLASPITLIALLTTVAHSWRQEALTENYREVQRIGKEFYERLATFTERYDELRKKLDGAVQAYNEAAGSLEARVLVTARRLRDLEVTTSAELPLAEPIQRVPRAVKQSGLVGVAEDTTLE